MYLYLLLNLGTISIPFLYSFNKKMMFIKQWKSLFLSIMTVALFFIVWDIIFTSKGVWGFNSSYPVSYTHLTLPTIYAV